MDRSALRRMMAVTVVVALAALVAVGCGDDDDGSAGSSSTVGSASSSTSSSTSTPADCDATGGEDPQQAAGGSTMLLTDVVVTTTDDGCADRITFSFRAQDGVDAVPGYLVEYREPPFSDAGSGEAREVDGAAYLVVRFEPAAIADLSLETAPPTYDGPREIVPEGTANVQELELYDAFEGVVAWVVGLDQRVTFTVEASSSPPSVTVVTG